MLNSEWFKIPLSFAEAPWYRETYGMSVITHLLLSADENGQVTEAVIVLAEEIGINNTNLTKALLALEKAKLISLRRLNEPNERMSIQVINFDEYFGDTD